VAAGITPARLSALSVLAYGGARTLGQLAEIEQVKPPTMSRLVTAMEAEELVLRSADLNDGRVTLLRVSAKGRRVLGRARDARLALLEELIGSLPKVERRQLGLVADLMEKVATSVP
jgi:DNA-binding MarR family transcriptional regulator